jgi:hypothetical protein
MKSSHLTACFAFLISTENASTGQPDLAEAGQRAREGLHQPGQKVRSVAVPGENSIECYKSQ